jgi:hypothetical protein
MKCENKQKWRKKMSRYDEIKGNMQSLYEAAKAELKELDKKRESLVKEIEMLSSLCGKSEKKTYSIETLKATSSKAPRKAAAKKHEKAPRNAEGKKKRIKEETIRELVVKYLNEAAPNSMSPVEIFTALVTKESLPETQSFRTRVYGRLTTWANEGIIRKVGRGVYQSVNIPESK